MVISLLLFRSRFVDSSDVHIWSENSPNSTVRYLTRSFSRSQKITGVRQRTQVTGSAAGLDAGAATLTITDDDPAPTAVTLSLSPNVVGENATMVTVTASLNNSPLPTATAVTVSVTRGDCGLGD